MSCDNGQRKTAILHVELLYIGLSRLAWYL